MGTIHLPPTGKDSFSYHSPSTSASSTYCLQQHHMINILHKWFTWSTVPTTKITTPLHRDGHHSSTSNRHVSERAKTSCSAPTQSRSPSAHRSRSVSAALRQAGSPVKTWRCRHNSFFGYYRPFPQRSSIFTLKNAQSVLFLQASLLSSDPSGSGLTIGPNAWLKRKVINFKLWFET